MHTFTVYLVDSPVMLFFLVFLALFVVFKLAVWLIKAIPFL